MCAIEKKYLGKLPNHLPPSQPEFFPGGPAAESPLSSTKQWDSWIHCWIVNEQEAHGHESKERQSPWRFEGLDQEVDYVENHYPNMLR